MPEPGKPDLASAVVMMRDDDAVLLVRHPQRAGEDVGPFDGRWSLPMAAVVGMESAEDAVARVMRDQLHVAPGPLEFNDTIYMVGGDGSRFVVNAFLAVGWEGDPRFSGRDYADAAWVEPGGALDLDGELADGIAEWLARVFERDATALTPDALLAALDAARAELVAAFDAIPQRYRDEPLEGDWSPLDVIAHAADAEAYYAAETRRILTVPGHAWQGFNDAQWSESRALRRATGERDGEDAVRARLARARANLRGWLRTLTPVDLDAYGNHPERGVVQVGDRIDKIARHDREHAEQLRGMARAARVQAAAQET